MAQYPIAPMSIHILHTLPICNAHCGGALRERTLHSHQVTRLGFLLLLLYTFFVVQGIRVHERQVAMKLIIQVLELGPV